MRSSSKLPVLTAAGRHWLTLALLLLLLGTGLGNWLLAALGVCALGALLCLYLGFFPTAILIWRRYLELVWWLPRPASGGNAETAAGLIAHRPFTLKLALRNLSPLSLGFATLRVFASRCVVPTAPLPILVLPPRSEVTGELSLESRQAGSWFLHGAAVRIHDRLGLFAVEAYFPSATPLRVLPRQQGRVALPALRIGGGAADERLGAHTLRQRGVGGELRELRDYVPGDPFKLIAWKASARAPLGRLLVRDLDRETLLLHTLLLDIGPGMREGAPGSWKLDHAIELCQAYSRAVDNDGDRVALLTYDNQVYSALRPGDGPAHRLRITERLLATTSVVDERFTSLGDAELCAAVARYLRQQEGVDVRTRRPRAMDDAAAWAQVVVTAAGEVYNSRLLLSTVRRVLERDSDRESRGDGALAEPERRGAGGREPRPAEDHLPEGDMAVLRLFCLRRGIELPYGRPPGGVNARRVDGLAEALRWAAAQGGAQRIVVLSDLTGLFNVSAAPLDGLPPEFLPVAQAAALCRRRGCHLLCLAPSTPRYLPAELLRHPRAARAAEIFGWEVARREELSHQAMARLGFRVIGVGPDESLGPILARASLRREVARPFNPIDLSRGP